VARAADKIRGEYRVYFDVRPDVDEGLPGSSRMLSDVIAS